MKLKKVICEPRMYHQNPRTKMSSYNFEVENFAADASFETLITANSFLLLNLLFIYLFIPPIGSLYLAPSLSINHTHVTS